jgi:hypothetical protein
MPLLLPRVLEQSLQQKLFINLNTDINNSSQQIEQFKKHIEIGIKQIIDNIW